MPGSARRNFRRFGLTPPERKAVPQSKHRRKPGGKSAKHPCRAAERAQASAANQRKKTHDRICDTHLAAVNEAFGGTNDDARFMAELFAGYTNPGNLTASKAEVFANFTYEAPVRPDAQYVFLPPYPGDPPPPDEEIAALPPVDDPLPALTRKDADAALQALIEHDLIVVDGDRLSFPPRFTGGGKPGRSG
jgi:hypothetical protein